MQVAPRKRFLRTPACDKLGASSTPGKAPSMGIEVGGLLGLLLLVADIWAIVKTVQSGASTGAKVFWVVLILILPLLGFIIWLIFGPKGCGDRKSTRLNSSN